MNTAQPNYALILTIGLACVVALSIAVVLLLQGRPRFSLRNLRIVFSIVCGIACLLLIVLWVRSYVYSDSVTGPFSETKQLFVGSLAGAIQLRLDDRKWSNPNSFHWRNNTKAVEDLNKSLKSLFEMQAKLGSKETFRRIDMTMKIGWDGETLFLPYWLLVLVFGVLSAVIGMRRPYRFHFNLRTLLIAPTLVAVLLGAVIGAVR